jgi:hypothetical protein
MPRPLPIIFLLASLLATPASAAPVRGLQPALRLTALATRLADGPPPLQADLARIALQTLSEVYAEEAQRAQQDLRNQRRDHDLPGWIAGVQRLAQEYAALAERITPDTPVRLSVGPDHSLHLVVDGQLVVVSSPRMNEQAAFEQDILRQFCTLNRCDDLVEAPVATAAPDTDTPLPVHWTFSDHAGPSCSSGDGLEFQFRNLRNLARKRTACASALVELHRLAAAIAHEISMGVHMDWEALAIYSRPEPDQQKVVLNHDGESLQLSLPFLSVHPELLPLVIPWLDASVRGQHYPLVLINAGDRLGTPGNSLD